MSTRIINLNSHPIIVERSDGSVYEYPPDGRVLRLEMMDDVIKTIDDNPIIQRVYYEPADDIIPSPSKDTWYIVPSQVTQIMARPDFISPDTKGANGAKRDGRGQVLSVKRFRTCDQLRRKEDQ
jgi:hypothetical protein